MNRARISVVRLNEAALAKKMNSDSASNEDGMGAQCLDYLKTASFRVWTRSAHLVLFPVFRKDQPACQYEYVMNRN